MSHPSRIFFSPPKVDWELERRPTSNSSHDGCEISIGVSPTNFNDQTEVRSNKNDCKNVKVKVAPRFDAYCFLPESLNVESSEGMSREEADALHNNYYDPNIADQCCWSEPQFHRYLSDPEGPISTSRKATQLRAPKNLEAYLTEYHDFTEKSRSGACYDLSLLPVEEQIQIFNKILRAETKNPNHPGLDIIYFTYEKDFIALPSDPNDPQAVQLYFETLNSELQQLSLSEQRLFVLLQEYFLNVTFPEEKLDRNSLLVSSFIDFYQSTVPEGKIGSFLFDTDLDGVYDFEDKKFRNSPQDSKEEKSKISKMAEEILNSNVDFDNCVLDVFREIELQRSGEVLEIRISLSVYHSKSKFIKEKEFLTLLETRLAEIEALFNEELFSNDKIRLKFETHKPGMRTYEVPIHMEEERDELGYDNAYKLSELKDLPPEVLLKNIMESVMHPADLYYVNHQILGNNDLSLTEKPTWNRIGALTKSTFFRVDEHQEKSKLQDLLQKKIEIFLEYVFKSNQNICVAALPEMPRGHGHFGVTVTPPLRAHIRPVETESGSLNQITFQSGVGLGVYLLGGVKEYAVAGLSLGYQFSVPGNAPHELFSHDLTSYAVVEVEKINLVMDSGPRFIFPDQQKKPYVGWDFGLKYLFPKIYLSAGIGGGITNMKNLAMGGWWGVLLSTDFAWTFNKYKGSFRRLPANTTVR